MKNTSISLARLGIKIIRQYRQLPVQALPQPSFNTVCRAVCGIGFSFGPCSGHLSLQSKCTLAMEEIYSQEISINIVVLILIILLYEDIAQKGKYYNTSETAPN